MAEAAPNAMELASRDVVSRAETTRDRGRPRRRRLRAARPHAPRRQEDPHAPARLARARDGLRGRRSDPRADPGAARAPTTTWAASTPTCDGADDPARPLRGRRVRLRLGARREPPRRQLADGDDHVRPARRPARRRRRASRTATARSCPSPPCATPTRASARSSAAAAASAPGRCARSSRRRCTTTPASSARSERLERCLGQGATSCASAVATCVVDDTGDRFNTDLVSVLELEIMLEMADCLVTGGLARTESRGAHTRLDSPRARRRALDEAHAHLERRRRRCGSTTSPSPSPGSSRWCGATEQGAADGSHPQDPALARRRLAPGRDLHGRRRRRRPRCSTRSTPSRTSATARSPIASRAAWRSAAPAGCAWTAAPCWPARRP